VQREKLDVKMARQVGRRLFNKLNPRNAIRCKHSVLREAGQDTRGDASRNTAETFVSDGR